jgi:drug/metabolite transporter (DMT)-like permease
MPHSVNQSAFPRHTAVLLLVFLACCFAGNHIAARIAFDHQAGLLLAILCRSATCLVVLLGVVLWQRQSLKLPPGTAPWQLLLGLLIMVQSVCLYSAVARIPVAIVLLISNVFPILLALLTWGLGGKPPTRRAAMLMGLILVGLIFVLDVPTRLRTSESVGGQWTEGITYAFVAACVFACGLWISEHKLKQIAGSVRSVYTITIIFVCMVIAGATGVVSGGMHLPVAWLGWAALATLAILYTMAFCSLFVFVHRLDMARNAPVMNVEPVASLLFGWLLLDQMLSGTQLLGGAIVLGSIVLLTYQKKA